MSKKLGGNFGVQEFCIDIDNSEICNESSDVLKTLLKARSEIWKLLQLRFKDLGFYIKKNELKALVNGQSIENFLQIEETVCNFVQKTQFVLCLENIKHYIILNTEFGKSFYNKPNIIPNVSSETITVVNTLESSINQFLDEIYGNIEKLKIIQKFQEISFKLQNPNCDIDNLFDGNLINKEIVRYVIIESTKNLGDLEEESDYKRISSFFKRMSNDLLCKHVKEILAHYLVNDGTKNIGSKKAKEIFFIIHIGFMLNQIDKNIPLDISGFSEIGLDKDFFYAISTSTTVQEQVEVFKKISISRENANMHIDQYIGKEIIKFSMMIIQNAIFEESDLVVILNNFLTKEFRGLIPSMIIMEDNNHLLARPENIEAILQALKKILLVYKMFTNKKLKESSKVNKYSHVKNPFTIEELSSLGENSQNSRDDGDIYLGLKMQIEDYNKKGAITKHNHQIPVDTLSDAQFTDIITAMTDPNSLQAKDPEIIAQIKDHRNQAKKLKEEELLEQDMREALGLPKN